MYDDHGANGTAYDPNQPDEYQATTFARPNGTYTYPTNSPYGDNAADLVEFRMKPASGATAFRVTFNTMLDPTLVAFTIGLGTSASSYAMPHGANGSEPAQVFVTVHGTTGDVTNATTGTVIGIPTVTVDQTRRQFTVLLPYSVYDTRGNTSLRVGIAAGLWNGMTGTYLLPSTASSATTPGGAGTLTSPCAFFNVGFRHNEPAIGPNDPASQTSYWRESLQSTDLANDDLSSFYDLVDMTKLAAGANDDMHGQPQGVPTSGDMDRIYASHFEPFQGRRFTGCNGNTGPCPPEYGNQLQPYAVYVPVEAPPPGGYPLTLQLHSLSSDYNQFQNTMNQHEFGERDGGSIVFTAEDRGTDNWYYNLGEADTFEVWADIARNYPINENHVALTGYSMGGYATFKLGVRWPDLFGKMQPTVGPSYAGTEGAGSGGPTDTTAMFATLRNIPVLSWHAAADEVVPTAFAVTEEQADSTLALNFEYDLFSPAEHLTLALNDQYAPAATFLGIPQNNINPPHVTFVVNPSMDNATYGVVSNHAYWISNVAERTTSATIGTIDVFSEGFGVGDPPTSGTGAVSGTLPGGTVGTLTYSGFRNSYGTPLTTPVADVLKITATNIATVTINPARARVDCRSQLVVKTDGPLSVTLAGCTNGTTTYSAANRHDAPRAGPKRL